MNKSILAECRHLVGKNKLEDALKIMEKNIIDSDNFIASTQAQISGLNKEKRLGIIRGDEFRFETNKIISNVLGFLSEIEKDVIEEKDVILFVGASPPNMEPLAIEDELRIIEKIINSHEHLRVESVIGATIHNLQNLTIKFKPKVLHIACHSNERGLYLEDSNGSDNGYFLTFSLFKDFIIKRARFFDCIILNSCKSKNLGEGIQNFIPIIIIMNQEIRDLAAIEFSRGFYQNLLTKNSPEYDFNEAFVAGKEILDLLNFDDAFTVQIIEKESYK